MRGLISCIIGVIFKLIINSVMLAVIVTIAQFICSVSGSEIIGPLPRNELAPIGYTVLFTCNASSSLAAAVVWRVAGVSMTQDNEVIIMVDQIRVSTLPVIVKAGYNNANVECGVLFTNGTIKYSITSAKLTGYGPPQAPMNLSTVRNGQKNLVFSWMAPSSPDGVQLNYTVTVTNINTSVVRNYTTSNTSITLTRDNTTSVNSSSSSSECDQYVWSVTAVNPAGASAPANHTIAVSFIAAPNVLRHNILSCNENSTLVITIEPPTEFSNNIIYTVNLLNTNAANATMDIMNNLNLTFHIPDPHMWTNITVIVNNQCGESVIPVSFNGTVECPTSPTITMTTEVTVPTNTPNIIAPQSPSSLPTSTTNPGVGPVWAYGIGVILLLVVVVILALLPLLLYCRWRKSRSSSVKPSDHSSEMMMIDKPVTDQSSVSVQSVSDLKSKLPEYMTPADARKEADVIKQQNGASGTLRSIQEAEQPLGVGVYDTPTFSKPTSVKQVTDMPTYSDVFQSKTNSLRTNQREGSTKRNSLKANQRETLNKQSPTSAPPPPPPLGPGDYASLQHDTGQQGAQVYDIPQDGDAPNMYSSVGQPAQALSKDKYSELQHASSSGDKVHGTTNVVEYSVVGPKTGPPALPPPPSDEVVKEMNM